MGHYIEVITLFCTGSFFYGTKRTEKQTELNLTAYGLIFNTKGDIAFAILFDTCHKSQK